MDLILWIFWIGISSLFIWSIASFKTSYCSTQFYFPFSW